VRNGIAGELAVLPQMEAVGLRERDPDAGLVQELRVVGFYTPGTIAMPSPSRFPSRSPLFLCVALTVSAVHAACGTSSPLVWSAADDGDDNDEVTMERPTPPPDMVDAAAPPPPPPDRVMDAGVIVMEPRRPCGTGPGCDPTNLGGETCESLGAGSGKLLCDPTSCTFEVGLCTGLPADASTGRPCGTGPGCNVTDLGGESCASLGMTSGSLRCDPETCSYDTSLCNGGPGMGGAGALFGGGMSAMMPTTDGGTATFGGTFFGGASDAGFFGGGGTFFGGGASGAGFFGGGGTFFGGGFFGGGASDAGFFGGGFFGGGFFGGGATNPDDELDAGPSATISWIPRLRRPSA
jgi:hypothetical protein